MVTSSWWGLHPWGALARRERKTRLYLGYFEETSVVKRILIKLQMPFRKLIHEPEIADSGNNHIDTLFIFNKVITNEDLFGTLRDHRELIVHELYAMLTSKMRKQLSQYPGPAIGVHIRRGDFKLGHQTTPLEYFINAIAVIRQTLDEVVPVTVFTDADSSEINELLQLPEIVIADKKPDILDILVLSKSGIMILSKGSTFGYWAAFLSDALVIRPHYDWQDRIKENKNESKYFEIKWKEHDTNSDLLLRREILNTKNSLIIDKR